MPQLQALAVRMLLGVDVVSFDRVTAGTEPDPLRSGAPGCQPVRYPLPGRVWLKARCGFLRHIRHAGALRARRYPVPGRVYRTVSPLFSRRKRFDRR